MAARSSNPGGAQSTDDALLLALLHCSDYKYKQSRFINQYPRVQSSMDDMFLVVMHNLIPLFAQHRVTIDLLTQANESHKPYADIEPSTLVNNLDERVMKIIANMGIRIAGSTIQVLQPSEIVAPKQDARILVGYIAKTIEIHMRAYKSHPHKLSASRERTLRDIEQKCQYGERTPNLIYALSDDRFDDLLTAAIRLYFDNSVDLRLTCPVNDPRLVSPIVRDIEDENRREPAATLIKFYSERRLGYTENDFTDMFVRQAKVIAASQWSAPALNATPDATPTGETIRGLDSLPSADTLGYSRLSESQLLDYIAWRAAYRSGGEPPAIPEAVLLHACELLNGVGADNPHAIMAELARLLTVYAKVSRKIVTRLTAWIRDLYVLRFIKYPVKRAPRGQADTLPASDPPYGFTQPFSKYIEQYDLWRFYPALSLGVEMEKSLSPDRRFDMYASISSYKIMSSKIYSAPYIPLLRACFAAALDGAQGLLDKARGYDAFMLDQHFGSGWNAFDLALAHYPITHRFPRDAAPVRTRLSLDSPRKPEPLEQFIRRQNGWACRSYASLTPVASVFAGWLMRALDSHLREMIRFPSKLQRPGFMNDGVRAMLARCYEDPSSIDAIASLPLDETVKQAVEITLRRMYPKGFVAPDAKPAKRAARGSPDAAIIDQKPVKVDFSTLDRVRTDADWVFDRLTASSGESETSAADTPVETPREEPAAAPNPGNASDSWDELFRALTSVERDALDALLNNPAPAQTLKVLAQRQNQLPAAFIESVNIKALDYIGDTLIEDANGYRVVEDYRGDCARVCAKRISA